MQRKTVTIVGIVFNGENVGDILNFLEQKKFFSKNEKKIFLAHLEQGYEISTIYNNFTNTKNNIPSMELIDTDMSGEEYFLGYRIEENNLQIPTNERVLAQIKKAQENWYNLFNEIPTTESISFELY